MPACGPVATFVRLTALTALCSLLAACGSGGGGGYGGGGGTGGGTGGTTLTASFQSIQTSVLAPRCEICHVGASAPLGLRLDAANAYALLVGVPSVQQPALQRVEPGDPDNSYLIRKLEGTAATGGRMPLGLPALPQADIDVIRQWITDGALPVNAPPPTEPIRVSSMSPLPDTDQAMLPSTVTVIFDRELNATTVDATTFLIERSGGDGTFGDGNEVAIAPDSVIVPMANPQTAVADLSSTPNVNDTYRVTVLGTGATAVLDLDGNALDGEFAGAFPSGDGTEGGDFLAEFAVVGLQPTLSSIQDNVFTPICATCHTGGGGVLPASMNLTAAADSFASLVNVTSEQDGAFERVAPGDADNSYVIHKLEGTQSFGDQMPPMGMMALDQATIDVIRQWIDAGASM